MKKWFKKTKCKKKSVPERYENISCKNCETVFSGKFCPECGQSVRDYDKPFTFIFYNFVGDFFAFDTRFFRTFVALLSKPGFLTKQYFDGKRVRYAPPFRVFIFVSFVLFLLLQMYTNRGLTTVLDSGFDGEKTALDSTSLVLADSILNETKQEINSKISAKADSLYKTGVPFDSLKNASLNFKINLETFRDTRNLRHVLNKYANKLETDLENETNPKERAKIREYISLCRSPEQAVAKILEYTSWAFFLLLPLFALILKLVYIRRKQNYMRHLVFSIHIHSFIFMVIIVITFLYMITSGKVSGILAAFGGNLQKVSTILMLLIPVYFCVALKKFYGQSWGKIIFKFFTISFFYNLVFITIMVLVFLNALSII